MHLNYQSFLRGIFFFLLIGVIDPSIAQETDRVLVDLGDEMYSFGDYEDALGVYLQAVTENSKNIRANYMVGSCYLRTTAEKGKAIDYLLVAHNLDPEIAPNVLLRLRKHIAFITNLMRTIKYFGLYLGRNSNR